MSFMHRMVIVVAVITAGLLISHIFAYVMFMYPFARITAVAAVVGALWYMFTH